MPPRGLTTRGVAGADTSASHPRNSPLAGRGVRGIGRRLRCVATNNVGICITGPGLSRLWSVNDPATVGGAAVIRLCRALRHPRRHPRWLRRTLRWLDRVAPQLKHIGRLTLAAVLAYLITIAVTDGPADLTGALTAVLVVQASAYSTVRMGLVRVGAVLTGVLIAVAMSAVVGLTWWSLGIVIALALLLAQLFRLGEQALETPISAMLILGVANLAIAAETRVLTTLIGAGTGVALTLLLPRSVPNRTAAHQVREVAVGTADALAQASLSMSSRPVSATELERWLGVAVRTADLVPPARDAVRQVRERRMLNPRALSSPSVEPVLRTGLDTLEASLTAVRLLFVRMLREAPDPARAATDATDDGYGAEVREAFSVVLSWLSQCIGTFGALVHAEAEGREAEVEQSLAESLESLGEARAFLTELLFVDARTQTSLWLLRGSILSAVEQIIDQLDLEQRARLRRELRDGVAPRLQLQYLRVLHPAWVPAQREHRERRGATVGR